MNNEITLDADANHKKVAHRNHLIKYFPIEESIVDLTTNYGLTNKANKTFLSRFATIGDWQTKSPHWTNLAFKIHLDMLDLCL